MNEQSDCYHATKIATLANGSPIAEIVASPVLVELLASTRHSATKIAASITLPNCVLNSEIHALERLPASTRKGIDIIPIRFVFTNHFTATDKLLLAFDAFILSAVLDHEIHKGKIVYGASENITRFNVSDLFDTVRTHIEDLAVLLSSHVPPELVLNRHCGECEFRKRCMQKAKESDDLSLLSGMSEKERSKHRDRGHFSLKQLSYAFRPRRRSKSLSDRPHNYDHALKALAIRGNKIHVVGDPSIVLPKSYAYFDVEGTDSEYYLIGLLVKKAESDDFVSFSLWGNDKCDERRIWRDFIEVISQEKIQQLIHYGRYETHFLKRMKERYSDSKMERTFVDNLLANAVNVLSIIYGQVYFPTYTNGLKDVATYLNYQWSGAISTGLESLIWRSDWTKTCNHQLMMDLCAYNTQDCYALRLVTETIVTLSRNPRDTTDEGNNRIVHTDNLRRPHPYRWERDEFVLEDFRIINQAAYWDYQREKVFVRTFDTASTMKRRRRCLTSIKVPIVKTVEIRPQSICSSCRRVGSRIKIVHDIKIRKAGVSRSVTKNKLIQYSCDACGSDRTQQLYQLPRDKYGTGFTALSIFLIIELAISQEGAMHIFNTLFGFRLASGQLANVKRKATVFYEAAYQELFEKIRCGNLVHADETRANVQGVKAYVWVFTSLEEVVYFHTSTREADFVREKLKDISGVLVTDFYSAYDAIECPQQKCLIHLMRDLNNDLMKAPFNSELKMLAQMFANLLKPMVDTVDRFGLRKRFLRKHKRNVEEFYNWLSTSSDKTIV